MSTPKRKNKNQSERDGGSRSNKSGGRAVPDLSSIGNATANRLSVSTRATLLGVRDVKDPFSSASDNAVKEFRDYIVNASPDEINLEECSLLLHATARLLSMQMKLQTDRINQLAAFVTNTAKESSENNGEGPADGQEVVKKKRGRKKNEIIPEGASEDPKANPDGSSNLEESNTLEGNTPATAGQEGAINSEGVSSLPNPESVAGVSNADESNLVQVSTVELSSEVTKDQEMTNLDDSHSEMPEDTPSTLPADTLSTLQEDTPSTFPEDSLAVSSVESSEVTADPGDNTEAKCAEIGASTASVCDNQESINPSNITQSTTNPDEAVNSSDTLTVQNPNDPENSQGEPHPDNTASVVTPSTRSQKRPAKENADGTPAKRRRPNVLSLPPTLSPNEYLDYDGISDYADSDDEMDDEAPILFPEVDLWNGEFDLSADPYAPVVDHIDTDMLAEGIDTLEIESSSTAKNGSSNDTVVEPSSSTRTENENQGSNEASAATTEGLQSTIEAAAGVVNGNGAQSTKETTSVNQDSQNMNNPNAATGIEGCQNGNGPSASSDNIVTPVTCATGVGNVELNSLTSEDQQEIQNCINQLHYLPFTCELTKMELERTFDTTVGQLEKIFKKYNTVFNRQLLNAATVVCANMVSTFSNRPSSGEQGPYKETETVNNRREIFSQSSNGIHADNMTSLINSEKTIFERTKEKSFAESQATIQKRLEEMQRLIVPRYIQWPLIAENTPEFFHRVKQFEQKMKKVLADEEKKESFDVSKYEIEVLKATESNEEEIMEFEESDDTNTSSSTLPSLEDSVPNGIRPQGMMSPSYNGHSSHENGRKWVPLSTVFNHMKKFDRNECARHFYAVLALLSSQNLDMNYDRHYSQESAALVTKRLDHSQDSKYPRGFKIMTSRCPDADKEEIYVTALASKSCNESFRDLISNEMHRHELPDINDLDRVGKRNDRTVSNVSSMSNGEVHTDSDEEFVPVSYTANFTTNLFGGRKKRKN